MAFFKLIIDFNVNVYLIAKKYNYPRFKFQPNISLFQRSLHPYREIPRCRAAPPDPDSGGTDSTELEPKTEPGEAQKTTEIRCDDDQNR